MAQKNTKERIMKIATDIFAHKGYTATSTREITRKAGVNLSMISYYFGSKEGLFKAIIEESFKPILAFIEEKNKKSESALQCLEDYFKFIQHHAQDKCRSLFLAKLISSPFFEFVAQNYSSKIFSFVKDTLEKGIAQGIFREDLNAQYVCISLLSMLNFYVTHKQMLEKVVQITDKEDYFTHAFKLFLNGIKR